MVASTTENLKNRLAPLSSSMMHVSFMNNLEKSYNVCTDTNLSLPCDQTSIRHFVSWRFKNNTPEAAIDSAITGYEQLPHKLPYFSHLETAKVYSEVSHELTSPQFTVALYSTFKGIEDQYNFVDDERRKEFKKSFVQPHLTENGVLVFDFFPIRVF